LRLDLDDIDRADKSTPSHNSAGADPYGLGLPLFKLTPPPKPKRRIG
jgi:hypothetical protein